MAPKTKITKEMILNSTFKLTKEKGFEYINARSLASEVGCSTQPLFSQFESMEVLKQEFYRYLRTYYDDFVSSRMDNADVFLSHGLSYLEFAKIEKNLFKFLFMSDYACINGFSDMLGKNNLEVAKIVSESYEITFEQAKSLYKKVYIFTHGIASMIATDSIKLQDNEAKNMLGEAFRAFLLQAKTIK